jgi:hypothetical protein
MGVLAMTAILALPERASADSPAPPKPETQAKVKRIGFGLSEITLPARAAQRLDIQIGEIIEQMGVKTAPFASIIFDLDGDAWVYMVRAPLTFVREQVLVDAVSADVAYLKEGPPAGAKVVTVGVQELYGTEVGVNGE